MQRTDDDTWDLASGAGATATMEAAARAGFRRAAGARGRAGRVVAAGLPELSEADLQAPGARIDFVRAVRN
jgi:hypothetical protein